MTMTSAQTTLSDSVTRTGAVSSAGNRARVDWVDYAKGFCIIFVVMLHATNGVSLAVGHEGWMGWVVAFAKPFRMPDFFMISGLFLARVIDRDWRTYVDRKVIHFAYFYVLWLTIEFAMKAPYYINRDGWENAVLEYLNSYWQPHSSLWFIYLLPIFFVVTKLVRQWRIPVIAVWLVGAGLEMTHLHTGFDVIDEFAARFVYFYTGYVAATYIFSLAQRALDNPDKTILLLLVWGAINGTVVFTGYSEYPGISLGLGLIGACAVVAVATLMARSGRVFEWVRYCGKNSIVIYLASFAPVPITRVVLLKTGIITDVGTISLIVTAVSVITPLILFWIVRNGPFRFLFERPQWARIEDKHPKTAALQPAE